MAGLHTHKENALGNARNIAFWVVLFVLILALFNLFGNNQSSMASNEVPYSEFVAQIENGQVTEAEIDGERVIFRGSNGGTSYSIVPQGTDITDRLIEHSVNFSAEPQEQSGLQSILLTFLPFIILIAVWIYFMNRMQGGGRGGAMGFGKSRAKLLT